MAGGIRILRAIPGSTSLGPILHDFCRRGDGIVTAFSDSVLYVCRQSVPDDVPVEVVPFGKLVRDLLSLCGELTPLIASSGHSAAAIGQACRELQPDSPFYASANFEGTHRAIEDTLGELADWGIDTDSLKDLAGKTSPFLGAKLTSLAQVSEGASRLLEVFGRTKAGNLIRSCLDAVPENDGAVKRVLVLAQGDVPPMKARWLEWVANYGVDVTLVIDRHATGAQLFTSANVAAGEMKGVVEEVGSGNLLLNNLFSAEESGGPEVKVSITHAADPLAEAEWAVRGCLALDEPDRSAIYVRDLVSYAPLIESAARRLGLQIRMHRRAPLLTNSFARLTLAALEFCGSNDVRSLQPIGQSSYMKLDGAKRKLLGEGLREAHRMRVLQWDTLARWAEEHVETFPWLPILLEWRNKTRSGPYVWRHWLPLLNDIVRADERLPWSTAAMDGDRRMRDRDLRARNRIEHLLGDYVSVQNALGERLVTLDEMLGVCRKLWNDADVSVPAEEFGVIVTNSAETISGADTLFVLGMLEGVFPRRRSEDPVLTDDERAEISRLVGGTPLRNSHDKAQEERDEFYRVCAAAGNNIVFSYPAADENRDNIPAFYLEEVKRAVGLDDNCEIEHPRSLLAPVAPECANEADTRLRTALDSPREYPPAVELVTIDARQALIPIENAFTPSELRDALQCPFAYVARRRLNVHPKRHQTRWASLRKLPQFAQVLKSKGAEEAEGALIRTLDNQLDELISEIPPWEIQLLRSGGMRLIQDWVRREMKARDRWPKDDGTLHTDVYFGNEIRAEMPKGIARLKGTMAGISEAQGYKIGHLYVSRVPEGRELTDTDTLYYGVHFLALHERSKGGALELESMSGERVLLMLTRQPGTFFPSHQPDVKAVDLCQTEDIGLWRQTFYESVTKLLKDALANIQSGSVEPKRGDHCTWCDYGELCRRSAQFSEDDSPFGRDVTLDEP